MTKKNKPLTSTTAEVFSLTCECGHQSICRDLKTHQIKKRLHYKRCPFEKPKRIINTLPGAFTSTGKITTITEMTKK